MKDINCFTRKFRFLPLYRFLIFALSFSLLFSISSLSFAVDKPLKVVTTTSMIADAVREIGGEHVNVTALMGPGVDPHAYRQTRSDIAKLVRADLVLWHGLYLEAQLEAFFQDLANRKTVIAVGEQVPKNKLLAHDDYDNRFDPHVWMNPDLWVFVVKAVHQALVEADPKHQATYAENLKVYSEQLAQLSNYAKRVLASVPKDQRMLITAHDAFNYFGQAYAFDVVGIQGISTESEAGLKRIQELVNLIVKRNVTAVFVESSVADRNVKALIEGAAAKGQEVRIGGELFSDAMGQPGTYEGTYIGMIDHNVTLIAQALGGTAPSGGMDGRLGAGN